MLENTDTPPVVVGITGASGSVIAKRLVDKLLLLSYPVILCASSSGRLVWHEEMDISFGETVEDWSSNRHFSLYAPSDLRAPIASGTFPVKGMVIVPCSMATVASIAHGMSDNLVRRAADVCLKEKTPLVIVPRETPLNTIHLQNMGILSNLCVTVLPPEIPFYMKPESIQDVVEFVANRIMLALGLTSHLPGEMHYKGRQGF